jgi:hypothetical protein
VGAVYEQGFGWFESWINWRERDSFGDTHCSLQLASLAFLVTVRRLMARPEPF